MHDNEDVVVTQWFHPFDIVHGQFDVIWTVSKHFDEKVAAITSKT